MKGIKSCKRFILTCLAIIPIMISACSSKTAIAEQYKGQESKWSVVVKTAQLADENGNAYFEAFFTCMADSIPYQDDGTLSFSLGTSAGGPVLTYRENEGYVIAEYSQDALAEHRIELDEKNVFTIRFEYQILDSLEQTENARIQIQISDADGHHQFNLLPKR